MGDPQPKTRWVTVVSCSAGTRKPSKVRSDHRLMSVLSLRVFLPFGHWTLFTTRCPHVHNPPEAPPVPLLPSFHGIGEKNGLESNLEGEVEVRGRGKDRTSKVVENLRAQGVPLEPWTLRGGRFSKSEEERRGTGCPRHTSLRPETLQVSPPKSQNNETLCRTSEALCLCWISDSKHLCRLPVPYRPPPFSFWKFLFFFFGTFWPDL